MVRIRYARRSDVPDILHALSYYNMHHVPSPEVPEFDYKLFYVAELNSTVVGAAGFKIISPEKAKTTLMAVLPKYRGLKIGEMLQLKRMQAVRSLGCKSIITNSDRPEIIEWYKRKFGYKEIGKLKKIHPFGREDIDEWTTLESDLTGLALPPAGQNKLIINVALSGNVPTKKDTPHVPVSPGEIAEDALRAYREGAAILHIHARDEMGRHTSDSNIYARIISSIREKAPDVIICASTSGRIVRVPKARADVLNLPADLLPDMASLTLGSFNFPRQASINEPETIKYLAAKMMEKKVLPEVEVFEVGMLEYAKHLVAKGILQLPLYLNVILGSLGTMSANQQHLKYLCGLMPVDTVWAVGGVGSYQERVENMALELGGGVRTGLEDSIWFDEEKRELATNVGLTARIAEKARRLGIDLATPDEVRTMLGLDRGVAGRWS